MLPSMFSLLTSTFHRPTRTRLRQRKNQSCTSQKLNRASLLAPQNFTMIDISIKCSSLRRSGKKTPVVLPGVPQACSAGPSDVCPDEEPLLQAKNCGKLLLPPGGVIPPRPVQYGTFAWR